MKVKNYPLLILSVVIFYLMQKFLSGHSYLESFLLTVSFFIILFIVFYLYIKIKKRKEK